MHINELGLDAGGELENVSQILSLGSDFVSVLSCVILGKSYNLSPSFLTCKMG